MRSTSVYPQQPIRHPVLFAVSLALIAIGTIAMFITPQANLVWTHIIEGFISYLGYTTTFLSIIGWEEPTTLTPE